MNYIPPYPAGGAWHDRSAQKKQVEALEQEQQNDAYHAKKWQSSKKYHKAMEGFSPSEAFYERFEKKFTTPYQFRRALLKWLRSQKKYKFTYVENKNLPPVIRGYQCRYDFLYNRLEFSPYPIVSTLPVVSVPFTSFEACFEKAFGQIGVFAAKKDIGQGVLWDYSEQAKKILNPLYKSVKI